MNSAAPTPRLFGINPRPLASLSATTMRGGSNLRKQWHPWPAALALLYLFTSAAVAQVAQVAQVITETGESQTVRLGDGGRLVYAADDRGNRLPDFSYVGYASGNLYDNVKTEHIMESRFRGNSGTGHGWAGVQTCFYNCTARGFSVGAPPGGMSWVLGSGRPGEADIRLRPASLYYQQVADRLGNKALDHLATPEQRETIGQFKWVESRLAGEK